MRLIETPAGERPLRTVPTPSMKKLLAPYNALAATMRDTLVQTFNVPELTLAQEAVTAGAAKEEKKQVAMRK